MLFSHDNLFQVGPLTALLILAAFCDIRYAKIPNLLTYPMMLFAIVYYTITNGLSGLAFGMSGLAMGIGLLILPYMAGGMGAGDAKLLGATGALIGAKGVFTACLFSALAAGVYAIFLMIMYNKHSAGFLRSFRERYTTSFKALILGGGFVYFFPEKTSAQSPRLRYAIPILVGTVCYIILNGGGHLLLF